MSVAANIRQIALHDAVRGLVKAGLTRGELDKIIAHARDNRPAAIPVVSVAKILTGSSNDAAMAIAAEVVQVVRAYDAQADYPHWDERHATTLVSTDEVYVETDVNPSDDGSLLVIRRTVWKKARRSQDQHILWVGDVAIIPRDAVPTFARDLVSALL